VLWRGGQVRAVGFPDLLIAALAERERVTVLHYDSDYELIAHVTGQPMAWVVPGGTFPDPAPGYSTEVPQEVRIWRDADTRSGTVTCGDGRG
jgi:hypothetical protein